MMSISPLQNRTIKALIFDLDGTLVSSRLDFHQIREDIQCPSGDDVLAHINRLEPSRQDWAKNIVHQHEMSDARAATLMPGVNALLALAEDNRLKTGIVTRNSAAATGLKLQASGLMVDRVLTREDAPPKPDPTALLMLCEEWAISPETAIYIGDFRYDLEAANNAGMLACLYAPETVPDYAEMADLTIRHFNELHPLLVR